MGWGLWQERENSGPKSGVLPGIGKPLKWDYGNNILGPLF